MTIPIPGPGSVGHVFSIPKADWVDINTRVALVLQSQKSEFQIARYIPNFADLLAACRLWKSTTFPRLIGQTGYTTLFAGDAIPTLKQLAGQLRPLQPCDPLPSCVRFILNVEFAALSDSAEQQSATVNGIAAQTNNFIAQNRSTDETIKQCIAHFPPEWQTSIEGSISSLESAMCDARSDWTSIAADFASAANPPSDVTVAAIPNRAVQEAITSWGLVSDEAAVFDMMAGSMT